MPLYVKETDKAYNNCQHHWISSQFIGRGIQSLAHNLQSYPAEDGVYAVGNDVLRIVLLSRTVAEQLIHRASAIQSMDATASKASPAKANEKRNFLNPEIPSMSRTPDGLSKRREKVLAPNHPVLQQCSKHGLRPLNNENGRRFRCSACALPYLGAKSRG